MVLCKIVGARGASRPHRYTGLTEHFPSSFLGTAWARLDCSHVMELWRPCRYLSGRSLVAGLMSGEQMCKTTQAVNSILCAELWRVLGKLLIHDSLLCSLLRPLAPGTCHFGVSYGE